MGLSDIVTTTDKGNAQGLQERQQAFKDISNGALTNTASKAPAKPAPKTAAPSKPNPKNQYGTRPGEKRYKLGPDGAILGQFKNGGKVKQTGNYKLHKGERVLNPKQTKKAEKGGLLKALLGKGK